MNAIKAFTLHFFSEHVCLFAEKLSETRAHRGRGIFSLYFSSKILASSTTLLGTWSNSVETETRS